MPLAYGPLVQLETFVFLQIIFFQTNIIHGNPSSQCQAKEIEDLKQRLESQDWQVQELEMQVDILKKALEQAQEDAQRTEGLPALSSSHQFPERASLADQSDSDGSACKKLADKIHTPGAHEVFRYDPRLEILFDSLD